MAARCFFRSPRYPGELHIARALFHTELEQLPTGNAFYGSHVLWALDVHRLPEEPDPV